jgi:hypothetical protein
MGLHDMLQGWLYLDIHRGITVSEIYASAEEEII